MLIVDLDDLRSDCWPEGDIARLDRIKEAVPTFKVTCFTIPALMGTEYLADIRESRPWIDMVPHGLGHATNRECEYWSKQTCHDALRYARDIGITTKGFKAPGWQISDGCYEALAEEGYWVADQAYNHHRKPPALPAYIITNGMPFMLGNCGLPLDTTDVAIHGHLGHLGGHNANALEYIEVQIIAAGRIDPDFRFISEVMR